MTNVSLSEALHTLQDIPLHDSNITVVRTSLDGTLEIASNDAGDFECCESMVGLYASRSEFISKYPDIIHKNFIQFASTYEPVKTKDKIKKRSDPRHYAVRVSQKLSSNPKNTEQFHLHCKYQLLRYKPWMVEFSNVLDNFEDSPKGWVEAWQAFMTTAAGISTFVQARQQYLRGPKKFRRHNYI